MEGVTLEDGGEVSQLVTCFNICKLILTFEAMIYLWLIHISLCTSSDIDGVNLTMFISLNESGACLGDGH